MSNVITPLKLFFFPIEREGDVQEEIWKCNADNKKVGEMCLSVFSEISKFGIS